MTLPVIASLALLFSIPSFMLWRRTSRLTKEIASLHQDLFSVRAHVNASIKQIQTAPQVPTSAEEAAFDGSKSFSSDMNIGDVLAQHPDAQKILSDHHLGGCTSCAISDEHKLGDAIVEYGLDEKSILNGLNGLVDSQ